MSDFNNPENFENETEPNLQERARWYAVVSHKHGVDVYFGLTEAMIWFQIQDSFDYDEVQALRGNVEDYDGIEVFMEAFGEVPILENWEEVL
jgi:hypothetical protein